MADLAPPVTCPHAVACRACPLIDLPYARQLAHKQSRVARALARFPRLAGITPAPIVAAQSVEGYRTRSKLVVGREGVGLYSAGTHALVDLPGCKVVPAPLAAVIAQVRAAVASGMVPVHVPVLLPVGVPRDRAVSDRRPSESMGLRAIDVRGSATEPRALVTLITDAEPCARRAVEAFGRWLAAHEPAVAGVFVSMHTHGQPRLLGGEASHLAGATHLHDAIGATRYVAGPGAFVQSHREQAARVHALVSSHLPRPDARVLDVYGGGGGIGVALAARGATVHQIESHGPAVADAVASAALNRRAVQVITADAAAALADLVARKAAFDLVVVNPPRRGCDPSVREALSALGAPRVAYVSCDPETLARDLDHLAILGYAVSSVTPLDMIPLTGEVECVALLERSVPAAAVVLWDGGEVRAVDKAGGEPTDPHPERTGCLRARVRQARGWDDARAVLSPDEAASGVAVFVRGQALEATWRVSTAASTTRVTWLALVRGITNAKGSVKRPLPGVPAASIQYTRTAVLGGHALLEVSVGGGGGAGVLRRLLAAIGHPVAGDTRYGHAPTNRHLLERHALTRAFLHCARVELTDPRDRGVRVVESALPADLVLVKDRLEART